MSFRRQVAQRGIPFLTAIDNQAVIGGTDYGAVEVFRRDQQGAPYVLEHWSRSKSGVLGKIGQKFHDLSQKLVQVTVVQKKGSLYLVAGGTGATGSMEVDKADITLWAVELTENNGNRYFRGLTLFRAFVIVAIALLIPLLISARRIRTGAVDELIFTSDAATGMFFSLGWRQNNTQVEEVKAKNFWGGFREDEAPKKSTTQRPEVISPGKRQNFLTSESTTFSQLLQTREATLKRVTLLRDELEYWRGKSFSPVSATRIHSSSEAYIYFQSERNHLTRLEGWLTQFFNDVSPESSLAKDACLEIIRNVLVPLDECLEHLALSISQENRPVGRVHNTDTHFRTRLSQTNPAILIVFLMAVALHLLAGCSQTMGSFCLQMVKLAMKALTTDPGQRRVIDSVPADIRTARKLFASDPGIIVYVACPNCHTLYAPESRNGLEIYPVCCSHARFPGKPPCSTRLCKMGVHRGLSIRVPIRPYAMQSFISFLGNFYSCPGIEAALRATNRQISTGEPIHDINQSPGLRELVGPDGRLFLDSQEEIRTIWSLSYDAFNPFHNKAAGKSASAGILIMICLSLPPELRYRQENMYLVGIIPGPKQPAGDALNPYLRPLIDTLTECYEHGTWFTRTYEQPAGRCSREALGPSIDDLPASRKISGSASHSAKRFCSQCYLMKENINNLDHSSDAWCPVTQEVYRQAAEEQRDATSKASQAKLYKQHGIRWSELLRLRYWDPTRYIVVDGMHNLFLGLVKHHFQIIIGIDSDDASHEEFDFHSDDPSEKSMRRGRTVLSSNPSITKLMKLPLPVLRTLCKENQVIHHITTTRPKKKQFVMALLASSTLPFEIKSAAHVHEISDALALLSLDAESPSDQGAFLSSSDILAIHHNIKSTTRPSWKTSPPANFGTTMHGKLKADEWRACIEFDLPMSLLKIWPMNSPQDKLHIIHSTFLLSVTIKHTTSPSVTTETIALYLTTMLDYLKSIRIIRPSIDLHPIHHNALHIGDFLGQFGPMRGWWMFPIERMIGSLQQLNTNYKTGQLKHTMLKSSCSMAQMRVLFQHLAQKEEDSSLLREAVQVFDSAFPAIRIHALRGNIQGTNVIGLGIPATMDNQVYDKIRSISPSITSHSISEFSRCAINGSMYSVFSASSRGNSRIFHYSLTHQQFIPAIIRSIFIPDGGVSGKEFFLAIHNYSTQRHHSLLQAYPQFGASIWSKQVVLEVLWTAIKCL
ncbi:hypothetical protein NP233_g12530 [Leucocoprinus birnbaumii]|uniref:Uncharacterized protein n=1 Tax=Leucocoprinus birnbaumii TaxID=56174 RepID=A0AAD5VG63_9AGAR|nr:hypothetical protein NP233_g12530 [Leucocoprinus birnbaumii]